MVPRRWLLARLTCSTFEGLLPVITAPHTEANYIITLLNTTKLHGRDVIIGTPDSRALRAQVICRGWRENVRLSPSVWPRRMPFWLFAPALNIGRNYTPQTQGEGSRVARGKAGIAPSPRLLHNAATAGCPWFSSSRSAGLWRAPGWPCTQILASSAGRST